MNKASKTGKALILTMLIMIGPGLAATGRTEPRLIDDFRSGAGPGWQVKEFKGRTSYTAGIEDGLPCLRAEAEGSASGLFYEIDYDPLQYPVITWKWKVDNIVATGDARTKAGDDYAARIYVVFPSLLFWRTRALNYIWANRLPQGEVLPNPYTANDMMVAVDSGTEHLGRWREHRRNVHDDYRKYFGSEPGRVGAIAVMTDTDNTGSTASACYGPIYIDRAAGD